MFIFVTYYCRQNPFTETDYFTKVNTECILTFPNEVNLLRSSDKYYSTDEAYKILKACGRIENRDMTILIPSIAAKTKADAYAELCSTVTGLLYEVKEEPLCAVYTCPPYTLLICKPHKGQLSIVDTHSIPGKYGGKMTAGVITPIFKESAVSTMTRTGKDLPRADHFVSTDFQTANCTVF